MKFYGCWEAVEGYSLFGIDNEELQQFNRHFEQLVGESEAFVAKYGSECNFFCYAFPVVDAVERRVTRPKHSRKTQALELEAWFPTPRPSVRNSPVLREQAVRHFVQAMIAACDKVELDTSRAIESFEEIVSFTLNAFFGDGVTRKPGERQNLEFAIDKRTANKGAAGTEGDDVVDQEAAHPEAIKLMTEDILWDIVDENAPFGTDEGFETMARLKDWRKVHADAPIEQFLRELFSEHGVDIVGEASLSTDEWQQALKACCEGCGPGSIIAISLGQLILEGQISSTVANLTLRLVEDEKRPSAGRRKVLKAVQRVVSAAKRIEA